MASRYDPASFEQKWRSRWKESDLFLTREEPGRPKFYGLEFFPYPSGKGLSVGHCRNYIPSDVVCRTKFMQGYNVLHPMGFDAFGLPAENEAIKNQVHPGPMVERYGDTYRQQMDLIGCSYDWSRSFFSSDPSYYKWTQKIFKLLFERGLAYRKLAAVNWDPVDQTVLADEEVIGGRAERSGALVEKKWIPQWFFKITAYADRLLSDLDKLDWPEGIKNQQRNWIGRSEGVEFTMRVVLPNDAASENPPLQPAEEEVFSVKAPDRGLTMTVFTTRIDTIFGVTFCVLAPEHPLVEKICVGVPEERVEAIRAYQAQAKLLGDQDRLAANREKSGVNTGAFAINPANGEKVPIFLADYVLMTYGTGAIMAVPGHDERDYEFAQAYGLPILPVIAPEAGQLDVALPFPAKDGFLINSGEYSGLSVAEAQVRLSEWMEALGLGTRKVNYKLRDWLISRQRYWGCPIPIMHTQDEEMQTVPDDCLPVLLPDVENYLPPGDGTSPLALIPDFVNTTDRDGRLARRETDTMGGFACSSWYFLRFADPHNDEAPFSPEKVKSWLPVDCYVGGAEHAVMHLLYARFWTKVLYDAGWIDFDEPFLTLKNQGQVLAQTPYRKPREGEVLGVGQTGIQITFAEAEALPDGEVDWRWARMSKSKGNVVTPEQAAEQFGVDALRVFELFVAPFEAEIQWSNEGMNGIVRFLHRIFRWIDDHRSAWNPDWKDAITRVENCGSTAALRRATHQTIAKVTSDIDRFAFNTAVAALMTYLNSLDDLSKFDQPPHADAVSEAIESLILLIAPMAPFSADELWESLGRAGFTYHQSWPKHDPGLAAESEITVAVQVNGKLRDTLTLPAGTDGPALEQAARESKKVQVFLEGKVVRKVIVVPSKLVNIVVSDA